MSTGDIRAAPAPQQLRTLVDRLTRFRPTAVAVEATADQQVRRDHAHRACRPAVADVARAREYLDR